MARLAVGILRGESEGESGSENDFPEISDLLAAKKQRPAVKTAGKGEKTTSSPVKALRKETGKLMRKAKEGESATEMAKEKMKPKKRVLGEVVENPLLRPLSGGFPAEGKRKGVVKGNGGKLVEKEAKNVQPKESSGSEGIVERARRREGARRPKTKVSASVKAESFSSEVEKKSKKECATKERKSLRTMERIRSTATLQLQSDEEDCSIQTASQNTQISNPTSGVELDNEAEDHGQVPEPSEEEVMTRKPNRKATEKIQPNPPLQDESDNEDLGAITTTRSKPYRKAAAKCPSKPASELDSDVEDSLLYSDGMSDFIVDDDDSLEEENTEIEIPPPKSVRKLVRGRKPRIGDSDDEDLELRMKNLAVDRESSSILEKALKEVGLDDSEDDIPKSKLKEKPLEVNTKKPRQRKYAGPPATVLPSSDTENQFTLSSPPTNKPRKIFKEICFTTPPSSPEPKLRGLVSPTKQRPRIPATPHRPSMDSFWKPEVINEWNDQYSPKKRSPFKLSRQPNIMDGSLTNNPVLPGAPSKSPIKELGSKDEMTEQEKKAFQKAKYALAQSFVQEVDIKVTNGEVSKIAAETGGIRIRWSKKLNTTAGRAHWRKTPNVDKLHTLGNSPPSYLQYAEIELAEKVIDDEYKLHNTIAHEFCHLANFTITKKKDNHHGKEFLEWGKKVTAIFADRDIEVTTRHTYEINFKFHWQCENCGILYKRHSKSIDPQLVVCSRCHANIHLVKGGNGGKELTEYQQYIKDNMKRVKEENPTSPQKSIMGLVAKQYKEYKAGKAFPNSMNGEGYSTGDKTIGVEVVDLSADSDEDESSPIERDWSSKGEEVDRRFVPGKSYFYDLSEESDLF